MTSHVRNNFDLFPGQIDQPMSHDMRSRSSYITGDDTDSPSDHLHSSLPSFLIPSTKSVSTVDQPRAQPQLAMVSPEFYETFDYKQLARTITTLATELPPPFHTNSTTHARNRDNNPASLLGVVSPSTAVPSLSLTATLRTLPRATTSEYAAAVPLSSVVSHHTDLMDSVGHRITDDAVTEGRLRHQTEVLVDRLNAVRAELEAQRDDANVNAVRQRARAEAAEQSLLELGSEAERLRMRYENDVVIAGMTVASAKAQEELVRELRLRLQQAMVEADGARENNKRLQDLYEAEVRAHATTRFEATRALESREAELTASVYAAEGRASSIEEARLSLDRQLRTCEARAARAEQERDNAERALARMAEEREREKTHSFSRLEQREKELFEAREVADSSKTSFYERGRSDGYADGHRDGRRDGFSEGEASGDANGYARGLREGREEGYKQGYEEGERLGLARGRRETRSEQDLVRESVEAERDELVRDVRVLRDVIVQLREEQAELDFGVRGKEADVADLKAKLRQQETLRAADAEAIERLQGFAEKLADEIERVQRQRDEAVQALRERQSGVDPNALKPIIHAVHEPIQMPQTVQSPGASTKHASSAAVPFLTPTRAADVSSNAKVHPLSGRGRPLGPRLDAVRHVFDLAQLHRMRVDLRGDASSHFKNGDSGSEKEDREAGRTPFHDEVYLRARERSTVCMTVLNDIGTALFNALQLASTVGDPILAQHVDESLPEEESTQLRKTQAMWRIIGRNLDSDCLLLSHAADSRARAVDRLDALLRAVRVEGRAHVMNRYFDQSTNDDMSQLNDQMGSLSLSAQFSSKGPSPDDVLQRIRLVSPRARSRPSAYTGGSGSSAARTSPGPQARPIVKSAVSATISDELDPILQYEEAYLPLLKAKVESTVAQVYAAIRGDVDEFEASTQSSTADTAAVRSLRNITHRTAHLHVNAPIAAATGRSEIEARAQRTESRSGGAPPRNLSSLMPDAPNHAAQHRTRGQHTGSTHSVSPGTGNNNIAILSSFPSKSHSKSGQVSRSGSEHRDAVSENPPRNFSRPTASSAARASPSSSGSSRGHTVSTTTVDTPTSSRTSATPSDAFEKRVKLTIKPKSSATPRALPPAAASTTTTTVPAAETLEEYNARIHGTVHADPLLQLGQQFLYSADRTADAVLAQQCKPRVEYDSVTATGRPDLPMHENAIVAHVQRERQFESEEKDFVHRVQLAVALANGEEAAAPDYHPDSFVIPSDREADRIHSYWTSQAPLDAHGMPIAEHTRPKDDYREVMGLHRVAVDPWAQ